MAKSQSTSRPASAAPPAEGAASEQSFGEEPSGEDLQIPEGVERSDAPRDPGSNIVTVEPTANAVVTVPSGASFQLTPGVSLRMSKRDADFLSESGFA